MNEASIRTVRPDDLPELVGLIRAHAEYERAPRPPEDLAGGLPVLLFGEDPRLIALVAEVDGVLVGYATFGVEVSTWEASHFLHMDCLYLAEGARGAGVGARIMDEARALAADRGIRQVRWQTPQWNEGAIRFYDRLGATRSAKYRYTLEL